MNNDLNNEQLVCQCSSPEHTLNFIYFNEEGELYGLIHLNHFSFFKRLWVGFKYILGLYPKHGHFEEFIMRSDDLSKLTKVLQLVEKK